MPLPADDTVSLPGFAFANATRSLTDWYGRRLFTTSTLGMETSPCAATKSLAGSKRSDLYRNWLLAMVPCVPMSTV
ncbi:hypothetical protein D9M72_563130 [compost metagenome]